MVGHAPRLLLVALAFAMPACRSLSKTTAEAGADASTSTAAWSKTGLAGTNTVTTLAVDPADPRTVFIGISAGSTEKGFFRTRDGGKSWTKLAGGLPDGWAGHVAMSPRGDVLLANPGVQGIWRSTNRGDSFTLASADPGNASPFLFHPTAEIVWTVTSQQGCFRSVNGGAAWARTKNTNLPLNQFTLGPLAFDGSKLYLGTGGKGVYVSTDNGDTWTKAASVGLPESGPGGDALNLASRKPDVLFVQTHHAGVFRSTNGAASFTKLEPGATGTRHPALALDPANPDIVFVSATETQGGPGGLYKGTSAGQSWTAIGPSSVAAISLGIASDGALYAGTIGAGVWRLGN